MDRLILGQASEEEKFAALLGDFALLKEISSWIEAFDAQNGATAVVGVSPAAAAALQNRHNLAGSIPISARALATVVAAFHQASLEASRWCRQHQTLLAPPSPSATAAATPFGSGAALVSATNGGGSTEAMQTGADAVILETHLQRFLQLFDTARRIAEESASAAVASTAATGDQNILDAARQARATAGWLALLCNKTCKLRIQLCFHNFSQAINTLAVLCQFGVAGSRDSVVVPQLKQALDATKTAYDNLLKGISAETLRNLEEEQQRGGGRGDADAVVAEGVRGVHHHLSRVRPLLEELLVPQQQQQQYGAVQQSQAPPREKIPANVPSLRPTAESAAALGANAPSTDCATTAPALPKKRGAANTTAPTSSTTDADPSGQLVEANPSVAAPLQGTVRLPTMLPPVTRQMVKPKTLYLKRADINQPWGVKITPNNVVAELIGFHVTGDPVIARVNGVAPSKKTSSAKEMLKGALECSVDFIGEFSITPVPVANVGSTVEVKKGLPPPPAALTTPDVASEVAAAPPSAITAMHEQSALDVAAEAVPTDAPEEVVRPSLPGPKKRGRKAKSALVPPEVAAAAVADVGGVAPSNHPTDEIDAFESALATGAATETDVQVVEATDTKMVTGKPKKLRAASLPQQSQPLSPPLSDTPSQAPVTPEPLPPVLRKMIDPSTLSLKRVDTSQPWGVSVSTTAKIEKKGTATCTYVLARVDGFHVTGTPVIVRVNGCAPSANTPSVQELLKAAKECVVELTGTFSITPLPTEHVVPTVKAKKGLPPPPASATVRATIPEQPAILDAPLSVLEVKQRGKKASSALVPEETVDAGAATATGPAAVADVGVVPPPDVDPVAEDAPLFNAEVVSDTLILHRPASKVLEPWPLHLQSAAETNKTPVLVDVDAHRLQPLQSTTPKRALTSFLKRHSIHNGATASAVTLPVAGVNGAVLHAVGAWSNLRRAVYSKKPAARLALQVAVHAAR